MIIFNNWQISSTGVLAQQFDHMTRKVEVVGDLPEGYEWSLLVECGNDKDTLHLERTSTGAEAILTQDNLCVTGHYKLQLRGNLIEDTSKTRHTNVVQTYVPASLTGSGNWPEMPSEFAQIEQNVLSAKVDAEEAAKRSEDAMSKRPRIGDNGCWHVWDASAEKYVDTGVNATGPVGPKGVSGVYVGSGDMPDGYNVQVDPDAGGEVETPIVVAHKVATEYPDEDWTDFAYGELIGNFAAIEAGRTYRITFEGEVYECVAYKATEREGDGIYICLGNEDWAAIELPEIILHGGGNNEPFGIVYASDLDGVATIYLAEPGLYSVEISGVTDAAILRVRDADGNVTDIPAIVGPRGEPGPKGDTGEVDMETIKDVLLCVELTATLDDGTTQTFKLYGEAVAE